MRRVLIAAVLVSIAGCASKRKDEPAIRIGDTIQTVLDTVNPNDTLPRTRDSVTDSAQ